MVNQKLIKKEVEAKDSRNINPNNETHLIMEDQNGNNKRHWQRTM